MLDPVRAVAMAGEIVTDGLRELALADAVRGLAAIDPDEAERIARANSDDEEQLAVVALVEGLAATDPDRAERIAAAIVEAGWAANAFSSLAERLAGRA